MKNINVSAFALNLREIRRFLSVVEKRVILQKDAARIFGITERTYGNWENDRAYSSKSFEKVAAGLTTYFAGNKLQIRAEDVTRPGLVSWIHDQIGDADSGRVSDPARRAGGSRTASGMALKRLTEDAGLLRVLGIDEPTVRRLMALCDRLRGDLDDKDWVQVARIVQEGREAEDLWPYEDPEARRLQLFFKAPRALTPDETARIAGIVQQEVEKLAGKARKKG